MQTFIVIHGSDVSIDQIVLELIRTFGPAIAAGILIWARFSVRLKATEAQMKRQGEQHDAQLESQRLQMESQRDATSGQLMRQMMTFVSEFPKAIKELTHSFDDYNLTMKTSFNQFKLQYEAINTNVIEGDRNLLQRIEHHGLETAKRIENIPSTVWSQPSAAHLIESSSATESHLRDVKIKLAALDNSQQYVDTSLSGLISSIEAQNKSIMETIQKQQQDIEKLITERDQLRADNVRLADDNKALREQLKTAQLQPVPSASDTTPEVKA